MKLEFCNRFFIYESSNNSTLPKRARHLVDIVWITTASCDTAKTTDRKHAQRITTPRQQLVVRYPFRTFGALELDYARKVTGRRIDMVVHCWSPDTSGRTTQKRSSDFCSADEYGFSSRTESNENDFDCRYTSSVADNRKQRPCADRTGEVDNTGQVSH